MADFESSPHRTCRTSVDKRTIIENYDLVSLAIDEIVDDVRVMRNMLELYANDFQGIILEIDPILVASRVSRPPAQDVTSVDKIDLSEDGMLKIWNFAKTKGLEQIRKGF
jgi:hypothetical protein